VSGDALSHAREADTEVTQGYVAGIFDRLVQQRDISAEDAATLSRGTDPTQRRPSEPGPGRDGGGVAARSASEAASEEDVGDTGPTTTANYRDRYLDRALYEQQFIEDKVNELRHGGAEPNWQDYGVDVEKLKELLEVAKAAAADPDFWHVREERIRAPVKASKAAGKAEPCKRRRTGTYRTS
jgi:hypothetical protein